MASTRALPKRYPVTGNDSSVVLLRALGMHDELGVRLVFGSRLDEAVLGRAVRLALDVEPVLGCGLRSGAIPRWFDRLPDLDARVPFAVLETSDADAEWVRFAGGFVDDAGPQVFVQLTRAPGHDEVLIRISHVVADGRGAKNCAYLLATLYARLRADPGYVPTARGPRPSAADHLMEITPAQRRAANEFANPTKNGEFFSLPPVPYTGGGRTIRERTLDATAFNAMRAYARARGATVNDMLVTACLRGTAATFPHPEDKAMSAGFSVDLRQFLDPASAERISNVPGTLFLPVPCPKDASFDDTLACVRERTAERREALWGLGAASGFDAMRRFFPVYYMLFAAMARYGAKRGMLRPSLSNLGVLEEHRLMFAGVTPVATSMSGPVTWGVGQQLTASTYRDVLTLSIGFCADDQDAEVVQRVLDAIARELAGCAERQLASASAAR